MTGRHIVIEAGTKQTGADGFMEWRAGQTDTWLGEQPDRLTHLEQTAHKGLNRTTHVN